MVGPGMAHTHAHTHPLATDCHLQEGLAICLTLNSKLMSQRLSLMISKMKNVSALFRIFVKKTRTRQVGDRTVLSQQRQQQKSLSFSHTLEHVCNTSKSPPTASCCGHGQGSARGAMARGRHARVGSACGTFQRNERNL